MDHQNTKTFLIVDDNKINRLLLSTILNILFVDSIIYEAKNGQEAIDILIQSPDIDMIFMDIQMPIMDGDEATKYIRTELKIVNIPIICITASKDYKSNSGFTEFIYKPVTQKMILDITNQYFTYHE